MPRPINEEFEDNAYAGAGLQPSVGTRGVIKHARVEYTKGVTSTSMRAGGVGMQRGGRTMKNAGRGMQRAGIAMSRSGVGAVVGVPLAAVGSVVRGVGAGTQAAGKVAGNQGRQMRNGTRGTKFMRPAVMGKAEAIKDRIVATRTSVMILSWATPLWFTLQLPLAILALIAFGGAGAAAEILPAWLVEWATGGILYILQISVFFIGLGTLIAMGIIYSLARVNCFFGQGSHIKGPVFCLAVVGYLLPFTNIFPWFILWALAVWRYPK